ncbi:MAG: tetratricopeptide repeat protein [Magnetococcales bacterium]|nr:tetratricopeptide repeat protein [Magnetococcales bacterium]
MRRRQSRIASFSSGLLLSALLSSIPFWAAPGTLLAAEPVAGFRPALEAANNGSGEAENRMGTMFATGVGAPYDPKTAADWYERAAKRGHALASVNLGMMYLTGEGVGSDLKLARQWIQKSADLGYAQASHLMGMFYEGGLGVQADAKEAERWYKKGGEQGSIQARADWSRLSKGSWSDGNHSVAVLSPSPPSVTSKRAEEAVKPPPAVAKSTPTPVPSVAHVPWKVETATPGNRRVSALFEKTKRDAEGGDREAQNHLGTMYLSGFGAPTNAKEALRWFQAAAASGHPRAQINLASMLLTGVATKEDPAGAAKWLEKAAEQDHAEAQFLLANLFEKGKGVAKDRVKALQWYSLAAGQGQGSAGKARKQLMATMLAADINKAGAGVSTFRAKRGGTTDAPSSEIQLASLNLGSGVRLDTPAVSTTGADAGSPGPQSGQRTKRGIAKSAPEQIASAAAAPSAPATQTELSPILEQWQKRLLAKPGDTAKPVDAENTAKTSPFVPLLTVPPIKGVSTQAQEEAKENLKKAIAAEGDKSPDLMLQYLTKAYSLDPQNAEVAKRLGTLSMASGNAGDALTYFRVAAQGAAAHGEVAEAGFANDRISELLAVAPPWVEEKLNAAGEVPADKAAANTQWTNLLESAINRGQEGDLTLALEQGQQALALAREKLGEDHLATILTLREVGNLHLQSGKLDAAEPLLQQSADLGLKKLGESHPETLAAKTLLAEIKESRMQLDGAIAAYRDISASYNKGFGPEYPRKPQADIALARVLKNQGNNTESEKILRAACPVMSKVFGYYHPETASCLQQYADVLRAGGQFDNALKELNSALGVLTGVLPKQDPRIVGGQISLAGVNRDLGHFPEAKRILLGILEDVKANLRALGFLSSDARTVLARVHLDLGELDQAQVLTSALYEEHKAKSGVEHPDTLAALADLAGIKEKKGLFDESEKALGEALTGYKKIFGEKHPATITVLNNLGQMMETAGLYDEAEPILRQAVATSEVVFGKNHPTTLTTLNNLALLHESQGNFDKAEPLYLQALEAYMQLVGARHSNTVAVVNNLAYLYLLKQDYAKSLPLFEKIVSVWRDTIGELHQRTLKALNNLARTHHKMGQFNQAETLFNKALAQRTKAMGPRHMDTLRTMHDLASLYQDMGRKKEAEELLKKTLSLDDQVLGKMHPYTLETINTLARVMEAKPDLEGAFQVRQEGFTRRTEFLNRMLWSAGDNAREGYLRLHRPELDLYLSLLARLDAATAGQEVLNIALKRKGVLLKITSEIQQITRMTQDPQLESVSNDLSGARKELAALTLSGPTPETVDTHFQHVRDLENKVNTLQMKLGEASKRFRRSISDIGVSQLIENLPVESALVDFLVFKEGDKDKVIAGVLIKGKDRAQFKVAHYPDLEAIHKAVVSYRSVIQDEEAKSGDVVKAGQQVYQLVWRPVADLIGAREHVYLVPDGILNILPFAAMVDDKERYLTQSTDLHILGSSRDLVPTDVPAATGQFLILAGPDYNFDQIVASNTVTPENQRTRSASLKAGLRAFSSGMRGLRFDPLPGAEKEGGLVADISKTGKKTSKVYIKNEAQEKILSELQQPPEVLHVATHGFFLKPDDSLRKRLLKLQRGADLQIVPPGDNPMLRSGLAFAGINSNAKFLGEMDTDNDGVLTALEVMGRNFAGTRLVVLSACETGLGEIHEGEGVYGLRRAFQEAGAQSVISSLWEVSDAGTQELMSNMYQRINQGMNPHKALRETQLQMIESKDWKLPYIWSAFMMVGL